MINFPRVIAAAIAGAAISAMLTFYAGLLGGGEKITPVIIRFFSSPEYYLKWPAIIGAAGGGALGFIFLPRE